MKKQFEHAIQSVEEYVKTLNGTILPSDIKYIISLMKVAVNEVGFEDSELNSEYYNGQDCYYYDSKFKLLPEFKA